MSMSFFVPTRFVWRFGGRQVHLCGSFTCWVETVPMQQVEGSPGVFAVVVHLPPGYHQYKFIVDGKWRHDETAPYMQDPLGNVNNWLYVRKIDPTPQPGGLPPVVQHPGQQVMVPAGNQHQQQGMVEQAQQQNSGQVQHVQIQQQPQQLQAPIQPQPQQQQPQPHPQIPQQQQLPPGNPHNSPAPAPNTTNQPNPSSSEDVDMTNAEQVSAPVPSRSVLSPKEPDYTRKKVADFLQTHTSYELIPESGNVVIIDVDLPVRQAFHALHEQGTASAPLWDPQEGTVIGVISASDFIHILKRLRISVSSGANPMNEVEMDAHTIRGLREEAALEGREPKQLVYVRPEDSLVRVVRTLSDNKCSMAPVLSCDPSSVEQVPCVLHVATLSGVLACIMRHFRTSLASLPILSQPLSALPIGTWSPDSPVATPPPDPTTPASPAAPGAAAAAAATASHTAHAHPQRPPRIQQLHTVHPSTPLTTALSMLLDTGVSALPVVDEKRCLLDIYARADITKLCKGNAYNRLQWEDVTVGQALALNSPTQPMTIGQPHAQPVPQQRPEAQRVCTVTRNDLLREVLERLARPGVRRVVVVHPDTRCVEGVISLSDVASFLFL